MDRQSLTGFVLIAIIITVWMFYNSSQTKPPTPAQKQEQSSTQSSSGTAVAPQQQQQQSIQAPAVPQKPEVLVLVETDKYKMWLSSKGMSIVRFELKDFKSHYHEAVQLIKQYQRELYLAYAGPDGKRVDTRQVDFVFNKLSSQVQRVSGNASYTLEASMDAGNGGSITRRMTFHGDSYHVDLDVQLNNMDNVFPNTLRSYDLGWDKGLEYQEANSVDESNAAVAFASMNESLEELDASKYNEAVNSHHNGRVDFIGTKTKYFISSLINKSSNGEDEYFLDGMKYGAPQDGVIEEYGYSYRVRYRGGVQNNSFQLYLGPLDYDIVKGYGMASTVNFGWKWLVRPIGEYIMLPIFKFIFSFIPNFGISIIIFSILMKLLLYPLSISQMQSAQKMKALQPEIEKLRAKYADDPTGMQQAQMKLYGEYGINPMGGCLPLLLQMPILYALYAVLTSNIHMRQAAFISGWIPDLSIPDHILTLPISVMGVHALSGMALIMGISMFIQQRMTITDPNQKAMVYMMPVMMTMMFSNLPSGLNLYYLTFNFLGIAQQVYMTKFSKSMVTLEQLKRMPKKQSWLQKRLELAQQMAEQQGLNAQQRPQKKNSKNK